MFKQLLCLYPKKLINVKKIRKFYYLLLLNAYKRLKCIWKNSKLLYSFLKFIQRTKFWNLTNVYINIMCIHDYNDKSIFALSTVWYTYSNGCATDKVCFSCKMTYHTTRICFSKRYLKYVPSVVFNVYTYI